MSATQSDAVGLQVPAGSADATGSGMATPRIVHLPPGLATPGLVNEPSTAARRPRRRSRWSWRVGTLFGVEIRVHATMLLLFAWIAYEHVGSDRGPIELLRGLGLIGGVFVIVLLHELGHALTARRFGIATRDITLLPIGGLSRLERMPDKRRTSFSSRSPVRRSTSPSPGSSSG